MKFTCETKKLAEAVIGVSRAVSFSSAVPVLQGILIKAEGFSLELTGYDLEMAITTVVEANVSIPGTIVLPAKLFGDILRGLTSQQVNVESNDALEATVLGGITQFSLAGMNGADFPDLPLPGADEAFEINAAELARMIHTTIYSVSGDDKKPAHMGELFAIEPGNLSIVALDGFRLAITQHPLITKREINIVVPAKTLAEVARLMGETGENIRVDANKRFVVFSNSTYNIISRLIEGEFLNYKSVIPEGYNTRLVVDVPVFEKAIERCSVIITERLKNPLRISFDENGMDIRCQTPLGRVSDQIQCEFEGEKVEIGFNYKYLLDALKNAGCAKVIVEISSPLSPVKILPADGDDFLFLVLPVRFKND